jgi:hypothetical protein
VTDENLTPRPPFVDLAPTFPPQGPTLRAVARRYVIEWPAGRPEWFPCSPGVIESLVDEVNRLRAALVDEVIDEAIGGRGRCGPGVAPGAQWVCQPTPCDWPGECPLGEVKR